MNRETTPARTQGKLKPERPNELTSVAPGFSGRVTNRPTEDGGEAESFNYAEEAERQEDA